MPKRDIITIGGSSGSLETLRTLIASLPVGLKAAVFTVSHLHPRSKSHLVEILCKDSRLPVVAAAEGMRIENGRVYVAVPDRHLLIAKDHVHVTRGPKEGLHRPSINATFRSAAQSHGERVVGVLLSGMLDDGAGGLWEIARRGGVAIAQAPGEAQFRDMPVSALRDVPTSYSLPAEKIAPALTELVAGKEVPKVKNEFLESEGESGKFSGFTCPECRGPLYEEPSGPPSFRCRVGHVFPLDTLLEEQANTEERKLYEAIVALREGADLAEYAARRTEDASEQARLLDEADVLREHAEAVSKIIEDRNIPPAE
jgi:two-component system, chemotaxis family, protein-glutamate methylesterase/glutaminase